MVTIAADLIAHYDAAAGDAAAGDASAKWRELMLALGSLLAGQTSHLPPALQRRLDEVNC